PIGEDSRPRYAIDHDGRIIPLKVDKHEIIECIPSRRLRMLKDAVASRDREVSAGASEIRLEHSIGLGGDRRLELEDVHLPRVVRVVRIAVLPDEEAV